MVVSGDGGDGDGSGGKRAVWAAKNDRRRRRRYESVSRRSFIPTLLPGRLPSVAKPIRKWKPKSLEEWKRKKKRMKKNDRVDAVFVVFAVFAVGSYSVPTHKKGAT